MTKSTNVVTTRGIIGLMANQVSVAQVRDFAHQCLQVGMVRCESPERDLALRVSNSNLPPFDVRFHFSFKLDGRDEGVFEILGNEGVITQCGYQVAFPPRFLFFPNGKAKYRAAVEALEAHYGTGAPLAVGDIAMTMNYGNALSVAYVSLMTAGRNRSLAVRIGNRTFWP